MNPLEYLRRKWPRYGVKTLLVAAFVTMAFNGSTQPVNTAEILQGHGFVFIAEWATANTGFRRQLIPTYELRITSDSVDGRLPFYGRVYSASDAFNMANEGFTLRSRRLSYDLRPKRKDRWQLQVEAQAGNNVQKLSFTIFSDGSARLFINSAWRDAMSYDGRIVPLQAP